MHSGRCLLRTPRRRPAREGVAAATMWANGACVRGHVCEHDKQANHWTWPHVPGAPLLSRALQPACTLQQPTEQGQHMRACRISRSSVRFRALYLRSSAGPGVG